MNILPLADPASEEPADTFWVAEPGCAVDEDLEGLYWRHILIDDPEAARVAFGRIATAVLAWGREVASWADHDTPRCPTCGELT